MTNLEKLLEHSRKLREANVIHATPHIFYECKADAEIKDEIIKVLSQAIKNINDQRGKKCHTQGCTCLFDFAWIAQEKAEALAQESLE